MAKIDQDAARAAAIRELNSRPERVLISLVRSQTMDLFAGGLTDDLRGALEVLRGRAPDGVKVAVDAIRRTPAGDGYEIVLNALGDEKITIADADAGPFNRTLGGGLCNLSKDLEIILDVLCDGEDGSSRRPRIDYLTWKDAADTFPGQAVDGTSRTSLIFRGEGFDKLILTERGPSYDDDAIDLWRTEREFLGDSNDFVFVGQEPADSEKFDHILRLKLKNKGLKVFWLVGGNQLKKLYTEYRHFLAIADVVSLNLAEAAQFYGFEPLQAKHKDASELRVMYAREISRRVLEDGANHVVITDGAKGAALARKARGGRVEFVYSPLIQENSIAVDPAVREDTGCGDSFAAAIAAYYLAAGPGLKLNQAANFAHYIAGIIYQRPRPNLTDKDRGFVEFAYHKAKASGAFVGKHETFVRDVCQIRPAPIPPRGPATNVLVMLVGGDPSDPEHPRITGAGAAVETFARMCQDGGYSLAPLVRVVPRLVVNPAAKGRAGMRAVDDAEMTRLIDTRQLCKEIGSLDSGVRNRHGVLCDDLTGFEGVHVIRVSLLEALEILSSEDFAERFSDIKLWHFPTEDVDERLVWHTKDWGVSREQSREIVRQTLRDYIVAAQGPQFRFGRVRATNRADFEAEMSDQLILRLDGLLAGIFRGRG
ncbi:MAG: carbohydrate kinase family protein [Alphaproteobacteria bacterium]|nr:carbohydrate kinase family protein [Alphaproteobacteria bacterium]